ncbi:MAG TPA: alpha/beta fold hydrolase [Candidatus Dormibacteraeota bacterium]|nr:alpha/beta fold hydrolase [Candidatus Dormibacteraeota bacterium]
MHFALIHGAYHGAWCWDLLRQELERDGHSTSAVDLPCEDPDAGAERCAGLVVKAIPNGTAEVVLVGHSLGGLTIPVAAMMTPTLMTVYLCALVPVPGLSFDAQQAKFGTGFRASVSPVGHADGSASWPESGAIEVFYHDCDPQIARDAAAHLRRQFWRLTQEVTPLHQWPAAGSAYILCTDDRMVSSDYGRRASRGVLGIEPFEMPGGHSPFLSRPRELAGVLEQMASETSPR